MFDSKNYEDFLIARFNVGFLIHHYALATASESRDRMAK